MPVNPEFVYTIQDAPAKNNYCRGPNCHIPTKIITPGELCIRMEERGSVAFTIYKHWQCVVHQDIPEWNLVIARGVRPSIGQLHDARLDTDRNLEYRIETRGCKLSKLLRNDYKVLQRFIREYAEEYIVIRFDALNLMNLRVRRVIENEIQIQNGNGNEIPIPMPDLLSQATWTWCYKIVSRVEIRQHNNGRSDFGINASTLQPLMDTFTHHYERLRLGEDNQPLYHVAQTVRYQRGNPHVASAHHFAVDIIPNIKNHLSPKNVHRYMIATWRGFFLQLREDGIITVFPRGVQRLVHIAISNVLRSNEHGQENWGNNEATINFFQIQRIVNFYNEQHHLFWSTINIPNYLNLNMQVRDNNDDGEEGEEEEEEEEVGNDDEVEDDDDEVSINACLNTIRYLYQLLNIKSRHTFGKKWSILPTGAIQTVKAPIGIRVFRQILLRLQIYSHGMIQTQPFPVETLDDTIGNNNDQPILGIDNLKRRFRDYAVRERFYETIFNFDHIAKNRRRYQNDAEKLFFSSKKELQFKTRNKDLSQEVAGMYHLNKDPVGLTPNILPNSLIVGIDPGNNNNKRNRDLISAVSWVGGEVVSHQEQTIFNISNRRYQKMSMFSWSRNKENSLRNKTRIHNVYNELLSFKVATFNEYMIAIRSYSVSLNELYRFNFHFNHREDRERMFAAQQSTQMQIAIALGKDKQLNHINRSTRKYHYRNDRQNLPQQNLGDRVILGYGDAEIGAGVSSYMPIPVKAIRMKIARYALVILLDEFRTSKVCSTCDTELINIRNPQLVRCEVHQQKKLRLIEENFNDDTPPPNERVLHANTNAHWYCLNVDDQGRRERTEWCREAIELPLNDPRTLIYPLKLCPHSQAYGANIQRNNGPVCAEIINRDVNASRNIRRILVSFIENNGQEGYRPEALRRQVTHQAVRGRGRGGREESENINVPGQQSIRGRDGRSRRGRGRGGRGGDMQPD
ncbi:hypothetical protein BJ944DRAFT_232391 [Cunninghamella echinulata]|nr:hypothetical protein BJ944DRAFT_232391 [Cunninghamella echinulata]